MINRLKERAERREEGFTLIELLIVIVVLGILAAIVVFALSNQTSNAAQAACNADAKSTEVAVEAYRAQTGGFPATMGALTTADAAGNKYLRTAPAAFGGTIAAPTLGATQKYGVGIDTAGKVYVFTNGMAAAGGALDYDAGAASVTCGTVK